MNRIVFPVCIVSAYANGKKLAITVSSITSVSIKPTRLLVCINNSSSMAKTVHEGSLININFLSSKQRTLSYMCADKNKTDLRFSSNQWLYESSGTPYLGQCEMVVFCKVGNIVVQSTHILAFLTEKK